MKDNVQLHEEFFQGTRENHFINEAVQVEVLDVKSSRIIAIEKIEKALDIIRCFYSSETSLEVITEKYYVVDEHGRQMSSSFSASTRHGWYKWQLSLKMDRINDDFLGMPALFISENPASQSNLERNIIQSLRWYRKAEDAPTIEDKLLAYWIVIENLMNVPEEVLDQVVSQKVKSSKFLLAQEVISSLNTKHVSYQYGWELYSYLRFLSGASQGDRRLLTLSEEVLEQTGLKIEEGRIHLQSFIDGLAALEREVDREIIKEKITFAKNFYENKEQMQKTMLEKWYKDTQDEMLLLYRLRNKIVHNAHYDYTVLPFYLEKVQVFANQILRYVVEKYNEDSGNTLGSIVLKSVVEMKIIMEKLRNNESLDM